MKTRRKYSMLCGGLLLSLFLVRVGEYLFDYLFGDQNGKMTTPVIAPLLSCFYRGVMIAIAALIMFWTLKKFHGIESLGFYSARVARKISGVPESTVRWSIFLLALLIYWIQSYAFPMSAGRAYYTYVAYYFDYWNPQPVYLGVMLAEPPISVAILVGAHRYGGSLLLEYVLAICYAGSLLALYRLAYRWGRNMAIMAIFLILLYPPYAMLYHQTSSDALWACGFFWWCVYIVKTCDAPSLKKFMLHGLLVFLLILIRPQGQMVFRLFLLLPFVLAKVPFRRRVAFALAFVIPSIVLLKFWGMYTSLRFPESKMAVVADSTSLRSSATQAVFAKAGAFVFKKLFVNYKLIRPENGPFSGELRELIQQDLLPKEPYKSYGITIDTFYSSKNNTRMWADVVCLADRTWGWGSSSRKLGTVAVEALQRYPHIFLKKLIQDWYVVFTTQEQLIAPQIFVPTPAEPVRLNAQGLPVPTGQQDIPRSYCDHMATSPDQRMLPAPDVIERKYSIEQQRRIDELQEKIRWGVMPLPVRNGNKDLAQLFNTVTAYFPNMLVWVSLTILGSIAFWDIRQRAFLFIVFMTLSIICVAYVVTASMTPEYRVPFDPLFLIGGGVTGFKILSYTRNLIKE
jgi:hypothetical protein